MPCVQRASKRAIPSLAGLWLVKKMATEINMSYFKCFNVCNHIVVRNLWCCSKNEIDKVRNKSVKMIRPGNKSVFHQHHVLHRDKCIALALKIINDVTHPLHSYFNRLPNGIRYNIPFCRTSRFCNTFTLYSQSVLKNKKCQYATVFFSGYGNVP